MAKRPPIVGKVYDVHTYGSDYRNVGEFSKKSKAISAAKRAARKLKCESFVIVDEIPITAGHIKRYYGEGNKQVYKQIARIDAPCSRAQMVARGIMRAPKRKK